jgi:hypothetical protein
MIANLTSGAPSPAYDTWSVGYRLMAGDGEGLTGTDLHFFAGDQHIACDEFLLRGWDSPTVAIAPQRPFLRTMESQRFRRQL